MTRRLACAWLGSAIGLTACGEATLDAANTTARAAASSDDDALVAAVVANPGARLRQRDRPYQLTRPVTLPAGRVLAVEPGTRILFRGKAPPGRLLGVFQAAGDGTGVTVEAGEAVVECVLPAVDVYAALAEGVRGFTVTGLRALNCNHVATDARDGVGYPEVVTAGVQANISRDIRIERGGASFAARPTNGHAACLLRYSFDAVVTDCTYENVQSGVQWWGGDANPVTGNGAAGHERKCGRVRITGVQVTDASISGIWGSMGDGAVVSGCSIMRTGDVGFDAEGSRNVVFRGCIGEDGANGCFGTFFLNDTVSFIDCHARSTKRDLPVFRIHNPTLDMVNNRRITIRGGQWVCTDPAGPSTMGTAGGPCGELTIIGATLTNVRIDTAHVGVHLTEVSGNNLTFPHAFDGPGAIRLGGSKTLGSPAPGTVVAAGNVITASAPAAAAIDLWEDDPISSASAHISGNRISGPFRVAIRVINASPNPAIQPSVVLDGNRITLPAGAATLRASADRPGGATPVLRWGGGQTRDGRILTLDAALGR